MEAQLVGYFVDACFVGIIAVLGVVGNLIQKHAGSKKLENGKQIAKSAVKEALKLADGDPKLISGFEQQVAIQAQRVGKSVGVNYPVTTWATLIGEAMHDASIELKAYGLI